MLKGDLELITVIRAQLQEAVGHCEVVHDYVSRELLEELMEHTEEHLDWLETQLALVEKVGIQNYLQSHM